MSDKKNCDKCVVDPKSVCFNLLLKLMADLNFVLTKGVDASAKDIILVIPKVGIVLDCLVDNIPFNILLFLITGSGNCFNWIDCGSATLSCCFKSISP